MRNVGTDHADTKVECFSGIKSEQLHNVMEKRDLVSPETLIIHVGTNDLRTKRNLDFDGRSVCVGVYGKKEASELQTCPEWGVET